MKRKWIILGVAVLAAGIAYYFTRNEPKKYKSIAQLSTGFTLSDEIKVSKENFDFYEADIKFNNVIVTCASPTVLSLISYTLILHDLNSPAPFRTLTAQQKQTELYRSINKEEAKKIFAAKLDSMQLLTSFNPEEKKLLEFLKLYQYDYKTLQNNLNIYRLQRTDYIQMEYTSGNPELSAFIVNMVYQQFLRYYKNIRSTKSQQSIDTLKSIMDKKKQDLDVKNALLARYGVADVGITSSTMDLISELEKSLQLSKSKRTEKEYGVQRIDDKLAALAKSATTSSINEELLSARKAAADAYKDHLDNLSDKALSDKYNRLNTEYQTKLTQYNASHVYVDQPAESKDALMNQKADLQIDLLALDKNISSLETSIGQLNGTISSTSSKLENVDALKKEREFANQEYLDAKQKYNDAMEMSTSLGNNFRQILLGQPAIDPEPSKRKVLVGMAGVSAAMITILVIVLLTYLDTSIKTPLIFSRIVNLRLISIVNFMNLKNRSLADIVANKDGGDDVIDKKRRNVFRESMRKLRYEVEASGKKIFLFTSTEKGQGKTTLIQALSYSLSLSKKKILIIDTNFCNNDLTLQLEAQPVLKQIVPVGADPDELHALIKDSLKDIGVGTVFAIGAESGDYTPSEILPRENLLHHLHALTPEFDYIFLEGPPLNDFSDSKELVQYVDGVIVVFSAHHIIKQIDKESIGFFKELNGKFSGSILNMVDMKNIKVT
jgi:uncharacterized protein involved in exopolysaccharide biosynthesis/Mrp family chromosome partitioning ATPase